MRPTPLLLIAVVLVGCAKSHEGGVTRRPGNPDVIQVADDDAEMRAAEAQARKTVDGFISELAMKPAGKEFFIKTGIDTPSGEKEHIWLSGPVFRDGIFEGKIANEPLDLPNLRLGSLVKVNIQDLEDWMIMEGDVMHGGFTSKLLLKRKEGQQ